MGLIWGRQDPCGPHVVPMNFAFWGVSHPIRFPNMFPSPSQSLCSSGIMLSPFNVYHFLWSQIRCTAHMLPSPSVHQTCSPAHVFPVQCSRVTMMFPGWKMMFATWGLMNTSGEHRGWGAKRLGNIGTTELWDYVTSLGNIGIRKKPLGIMDTANIGNMWGGTTRTGEYVWGTWGLVNMLGEHRDWGA